jgi:hypothetical protein
VYKQFGYAAVPHAVRCRGLVKYLGISLKDSHILLLITSISKVLKEGIRV